MVLVVMVFQCCVTTLPSCGVGGNVFQCCVTTLTSCGVGGNGVSVLCNHSAKLWFWW